MNENGAESTWTRSSDFTPDVKGLRVRVKYVIKHFTSTLGTRPADQRVMQILDRTQQAPTLEGHARTGWDGAGKAMTPTGGTNSTPSPLLESGHRVDSCGP